MSMIRFVCALSALAMLMLVPAVCLAQQTQPATDTQPPKGKMLIVVTSHETLGDTGKKTGCYLSEVAHPYHVFTQAGYAVDFVSPEGGAAPVDPKSINRDDPVNAWFLDHERAQQKMDRTMTDFTYKQSLEFLRDSTALNEQEKRALLGENAARLYGITAPAAPRQPIPHITEG